MASVSTHGNQDKGHHLPPPSKQSLLFCPKSKLHIHRGEISKIIRECQEESFWKRALPFSLVSMLATQGLVHQGKILDLLIKLKKAQFSPSLWTAYWRLAFVFWRKIYLCRVLLIFSQVHPSRRCPNLQNEWLYEVTWQREIKVAGGIK
uniref:OCIA domain-containing protein n=1 Tax=Ursus americanus TaxID=9643 RepID=A0A452RI71_URSAM